MKSRRTLIAIAAIVLAAIAFFGVIAYANSARKSAYGNAKQVSIMRVEKQIPKGFSAEQAFAQGYISKNRTIPQEFRPGNAVTRQDELKNKVALTEISPGQILVTGQFVDPASAQVTTAQQVKPGRVAVTVSVDQVHGVAGLLAPGDKVNMVVVAGKENQTATAMYQNIEIMAVGSKTAPQAGQSSSTAKSGDGDKAQSSDGGLVTFEVPLEAAERIALAASGGVDKTASIYLTLVAPENQPVAVPVIDINNFTKNVPLTPYPAQ